MVFRLNSSVFYWAIDIGGSSLGVSISAISLSALSLLDCRAPGEDVAELCLFKGNFEGWYVAGFLSVPRLNEVSKPLTTVFLKPVF